jgi:hypothetical protein
MTLLDGAFGPVYGQPSWLVRRGHGSFVTFEFGEPRLDVGEPKQRLHVFSPKVHERLATRLVAVHGAWHLWIYCCAWRLTHRGRPLARSESRPQRIDSALAVLDGQALVSVSVDADARTTFTFDLGCSLLTWPYDDASEQWLLYEPDGRVLTVRADGRNSHESGATPAEDSQWHPLAPSEGS